jgi:hypothetical protein
VGGGFGAGSALDKDFTLTTVIAPTTVTRAETFLWYRADARTQVGVAHLWKQNAVRFLASHQFVPETAKLPSLNVSVGIQGIGTGNPGYSMTFEKSITTKLGRITGFTGIGLRSNESHGHGLIGLKLNTPSGWVYGFQHDGHQTHPFVIKNVGDYLVGGYLIALKSPALMIGYRF